MNGRTVRAVWAAYGALAAAQQVDGWCQTREDVMRELRDALSAEEAEHAAAFETALAEARRGLRRREGGAAHV